MKRKIQCIMLSIFMMVVALFTSVPVFAQEDDPVEYQYVAYDGTVYNYFLDEEGSPYIIVNEEIVYILLPLEHLRVTDPEKLAELNETILNPEMVRSEPSNYYDISNNNSTTDIDSPKYSTDVNFNNITTFTTPVLKVNRQHATIRFKTSNLAVGQKVNFTVYYYDSVFDEWYSDSYTNKDCTSLRGFGIQFSPTVTPYLQFDVSRATNFSTLTLLIWTSGLW